MARIIVPAILFELGQRSFGFPKMGNFSAQRPGFSIQKSGVRFLENWLNIFYPFSLIFLAVFRVLDLPYLIGDVFIFEVV
jgi:hypothetical protein